MQRIKIVETVRIPSINVRAEGFAIGGGEYSDWASAQAVVNRLNDCAKEGHTFAAVDADRWLESVRTAR